MIMNYNQMTQTKQILVEGSGQKAEPNQAIKFIASLKIQGQNETIFDTKHPQRAILGRNQINIVLQQYLLTMKGLQKAIFTLKSSEVQQIVKNNKYDDQIVQLVLELVQNKDVGVQDKYYTLEIKQSKAAELKLQGNNLIKDKKYSECIQKYIEAYKLVEYNSTPQGTELRNSLLLNLTLAYMNNKQYDKSLEFSQKILRKDPLHLKAIYRKASALRYLGEFQRAIKEIKRVLDQNPQNKQFSSLLKEIKEHEETNRKKEKQLYGKMFG